MKIVVTGGSGFIGTNLIDFLSDKNFEVYNFDLNQPRKLTHLKYWINVDILQFDKFSSELNKIKPDYIIHLAARTDLNGKFNISEYSANTIGVENLMKICEELVALKRVIIASSMLVCKLGYIPQNFDDYSPDSLYGESKVLTEKIVKKYKFDWVIVRPTSIWGPWFREPYFNFFKLVIKGFYFNIPRNYASTKTYGYVYNTCLQIYSLMISDRKEVIHNYFYLGDIEPINITDWANLIRKYANKSKLFTFPLIWLRFGAKLGDIILSTGLTTKFPLSSFRYKNMTTDNIINDLDKINPYVLNEYQDDLCNNINKTLTWINEH